MMSAALWFAAIVPVFTIPMFWIVPAPSIVLLLVSVSPLVAAVIRLVGLSERTIVPLRFKVTLLPSDNVLPVSVMLPEFVIVPSRVVVVRALFV